MPLHEVMCKRLACLPNNSGHCWRPPCRCANNVQTRSNGIETYQVNPWSRWAGGPYPCRCRRSQQRLPQRESRPKRRVLFSLEFPFLSRHAMHTSCLAAPLVARGSQWFTGSGDSGALQRGFVSLGTQLRGVRSKTCQKAAADRPPGTHHSPSISGLNSSSSALRLDRLLRLRWLTARCPTPSHLALHGRTTSAYHSSRWSRTPASSRIDAGGIAFTAAGARSRP